MRQLHLRLDENNPGTAWHGVAQHGITGSGKLSNPPVDQAAIVAV
jgi:hypothetical protein